MCLAVNETLTYMSIHEWLAFLVDAKLLFQVEPTFDSEPVLRPMYVAEEVNGLLKGPWPDEAAERRCAQLRADLEAIVTGGEINVSMRPFKAKTALMGILDPVKDGVWDIRSSKPSPGLRVIGCFADVDTFVGLLPASRSVPTVFVKRGPLGDRFSPEWAHIISETRALWRRLIPTWRPIGGDDPSDYFSQKHNCI